MKWKFGMVLFGMDSETNTCKVHEVGDEVRINYKWYDKEYDNRVILMDIYPTKMRVRVPEYGEIRIVSLGNLIDILD